LTCDLACARIVELIRQARAHERGHRRRDRERYVRVHEQAGELRDYPAQMPQNLP
jgi:hypothetical protein